MLIEQIDFKKRGGLVPVIVQDHKSGRVLMLGYANAQAVEETLKSGKATFYSTSRKGLWQKGSTSGDYLEMQEIQVDCDADALLYLVKPLGDGACHTKKQDGRSRTSCFYRRYDDFTKSLQIIQGQE
jgi:phosphoribosyl-AMP cyclohydrolase